MSESEFWPLTLGQYTRLLRRAEARFERDVFGSAMVCSVLANIYRDSKKRPKPFTPADFMPTKAKPKQQSWQDMKAIGKLLTRAMGGKIVKRER